LTPAPRPNTSLFLCRSDTSLTYTYIHTHILIRKIVTNYNLKKKRGLISATRLYLPINVCVRHVISVARSIASPIFVHLPVRLELMRYDNRPPLDTTLAETLWANKSRETRRSFVASNDIPDTSVTREQHKIFPVKNLNRATTSYLMPDTWIV